MTASQSSFTGTETVRQAVERILKAQRWTDNNQDAWQRYAEKIGRYVDDALGDAAQRTVDSGNLATGERENEETDSAYFLPTPGGDKGEAVETAAKAMFEADKQGAWLYAPTDVREWWIAMAGVALAAPPPSLPPVMGRWGMADRISCAVCGKACKLTPADPDGDAPEKFGGWYCAPCDTFTETDVEVED